MAEVVPCITYLPLPRCASESLKWTIEYILETGFLLFISPHGVSTRKNTKWKYCVHFDLTIWALVLKWFVVLYREKEVKIYSILLLLLSLVIGEKKKVVLNAWLATSKIPLYLPYPQAISNHCQNTEILCFATYLCWGFFRKSFWLNFSSWVHVQNRILCLCAC